MTQMATMRSRRSTPLPQPTYTKEEEDVMEEEYEYEKEEGDDGWVDEEDYLVEEEATTRSGRLTPRAGGSADGRNGTRRRATASRRAGYASSSPRKPTLPPTSRRAPPATASPAPKTKAEPIERDAIIPDAVIQGLQETCLFIGKEVLHISAIMLRWLRVPIALFLVFLLSSFLLGKLTPTIRRTVRPLCIIPGMSSSTLCLPLESGLSVRPNGKRSAKQADYSALVNIQSKTFEQLLEDAAGGSALSLEIKKAEMATTDLAIRVRISDLRSKDTLATVLDEFVADAMKTGRGLQKLTAKVGGAVDNIMAVNDYALQSIGEARAKEPSPWSLTAIAPWRPRQKLDEVVTKTFNEAMDVLSNNMERLILEAEYSNTNLIQLEEKLTTLHDIVSREDLSISDEKSELLAQLWTKLGGNKRSLRGFDSHLALLKGLSAYRKQAQVHVVAALETLRAMEADMEDMRERVAAPDLVGSQVPAEVHMKSIQMGLQRLREGRIRAKKLQEDAVKRVLSIGDSEIEA